MKIGKYGGSTEQTQTDHVPAKRRSLFRPVCCQDNLVVEG